MKGLPDSVIVGTITNARRRAVQRDIAARRAGARRNYEDLTFRDYVGGTILLMLFGIVVFAFL
jgi:hypothetical protein